MPPIWRCKECGDEHTFEELRQIIAYTKNTFNVYCLEFDTVERGYDDGPWSQEQLLYQCPSCGNEESW